MVRIDHNRCRLSWLFGQWAAYIGGSLAQGRTLAQLAEYEERILAVTSADIQRVSQQIFNSPSVISIVGPSSIF